MPYDKIQRWLGEMKSCKTPDMRLTRLLRVTQPAPLFKNQKSQWRASSMMMEQKDKERRMAGPRYSPDTVQGTFVSKEDAGKLNQDFAAKKE